MVRRSSTHGLTQMRRFEVFIFMYKIELENLFPSAIINIFCKGIAISNFRLRIGKSFTTWQTPLPR